MNLRVERKYMKDYREDTRNWWMREKWEGISLVSVKMYLKKDFEGRS